MFKHKFVRFSDSSTSTRRVVHAIRTDKIESVSTFQEFHAEDSTIRFKIAIEMDSKALFQFEKRFSCIEFYRDAKRPETIQKQMDDLASNYVAWFDSQNENGMFHVDRCSW